MRISSTDMVAGQPALVIRKLLKKSQWGNIVVETVEETLGIDTETARQVIASLCDEGYLELSHSSPEESWWHNTAKGNALAMASVAPPIQQKTAEKKLAEFLERVHHVNESEEFVYAVAKVIVFGSYLTNATTVNDLDLSLSLVPKYADIEEFKQKSEECIERAIQAGKQFGTYFMQVSWPQVMVFQYLRARSRMYSLHSLAVEQSFLSHVATAVLFESDEFGSIEAASNTMTSRPNSAHLLS